MSRVVLHNKKRKKIKTKEIKIKEKVYQKQTYTEIAKKRKIIANIWRIMQLFKKALNCLLLLQLKSCLASKIK